MPIIGKMHATKTNNNMALKNTHISIKTGVIILNHLKKIWLLFKWYSKENHQTPIFNLTKFLRLSLIWDLFLTASGYKNIKAIFYEFYSIYNLFIIL